MISQGCGKVPEATPRNASEAGIEALAGKTRPDSLRLKPRLRWREDCAIALMNSDFLLREVVDDDLAIFFEQQEDPEANYMAAFTAKNPADREAFTAHWNRILADATVIIKTIVFDRQVVGYVLSYEESGQPEVSYWLGKDYWGKGLATRALSDFLAHGNQTRPIYARVAKDNLGSRRVLEKCGVTIIGEAKGFANARGVEVEELIPELSADESDKAP
jgi:RimJ/RimL family protein N-acetyltransferase